VLGALDEHPAISRSPAVERALSEPRPELLGSGEGRMSPEGSIPERGVIVFIESPMWPAVRPIPKHERGLEVLARESRMLTTVMDVSQRGVLCMGSQ
jgi:hypothetical protein